MALFATAAGPRSRKQPTVRELQQQVAQLERVQQATGAPAVSQDRPGLFATIVDFLSRPNYAVAGITEEFLNGKSVSSAFGRAVNELLSGVGPFEGQKRAFGQVLEAQGVPTKTLTQVFPLLEGTWVGNFGSRGAAGIALDILADPLTYVTFGASSARAVTLKSGRHFLSKKGLELFGEIRNGLKGELAAALEITDDAARQAAQRAVYNKGRDLFEQRLVDSSGKILDQSLIEEGGVKFFGATVPGTSGLGRKFSAKVVAAINTIPGGERALKGAGEFSDGLGDTIRALFHPNNELGRLKPELRAEAIRLHQDFTNARAVHSARLIADVKTGIEKDWFKELKADPELGRKFYEIREGTAAHTLTESQRALYDRFVEFYDKALDTGIGSGIIEEDMARAGYFHHSYKNSEDVARYHNTSARTSRDNAGSSFRKERPFDTYDEAVKVSRQHHDVWREGDAGRYPVLEPNYDLLGNTYRYIDQHSTALAKKAWQEQAVLSFGKEVKEWDIFARYELAKAVPVASAKHLQDVDEFFGDRKLFSELSEDAAKDVGIYPGAKTGEVKTVGGKEVIDRAKRLLATLPDDAKREFLRRLVRTSGSSWDLSNILAGLEGKYDDFLPAKKGIQAGEAIPLKHFGVETNYVERSGGFWGESPVMMPKIIVDDMEKIDSKLFNTKDHKAFGKLLRGFDRINNIFKLGVYTLWPASATRDAYSNVALAMLDIGAGAFNPASHLDTIGLMAGRDGTLRTATGAIYEWRHLRRMAEEMGVWVPGEAFVELTGDAAKAGTVTKSLKNLAHYRGLIENEARVQLWVQNIRRGLDPRDAADKVRQFLFDYGELSNAEREVFRRFIPFYTFTRKNIRLQVNILKHKPGLAINQLKPVRQRSDETQYMVKWEAEGVGLRLDRDGKTIHAIQGIDLPLRNLDTLWSGTAIGSARRIMGMITPVLKVPIETISGRDFFTGGDLKRTQGPSIGRGIDWLSENTGFPKPVKDWLGYRKDYDQAGRPKYTFNGTRYAILVRSWAFSRLVSTSDRQFREYTADANIAGALLDLTTGLRDKEINLDDQMRRKLYDRIRQLQDSLVRRGVQAEFTRAFTPKKAGQL